MENDEATGVLIHEIHDAPTALPQTFTLGSFKWQGSAQIAACIYPVPAELNETA